MNEEHEARKNPGTRKNRKGTMSIKNEKGERKKVKQGLKTEKEQMARGEMLK